MSSVAVIDYGMGNLHSIAKALQHANPSVEVSIVNEPQAILHAERVVLPGVGAIRDCMHAIDALNLAPVIQKAAKQKPFLGICLGMQALLSDSEENNHTTCLDIIPGHVVRFPEGLTDHSGNRLKIPHMGWNQVIQNPHPIWRGIPQNSRFYFVHSYYVVPSDIATISAQAEYPDPFACALARGNVFAVQFHPEKSQTAGLQLLKNFLQWDGTV